MLFVAINTGRMSITEDESKTFPTMDFGAEAEILVIKSFRTDPPNIVCSTANDRHGGKMTLRFILLNPTDFLELSVHVAGPIGDHPP